MESSSTMFWGLVLEPYQPYKALVVKPLHVSQAAMDISAGNSDPCQLMVLVDGEKVLLCRLQKNENTQVPLDLDFKTGDVVTFFTNGKCNVHLTGYFNPGSTQKAKEKLEKSKEEAIKKQKKEKKAKADSDDSEVKDEAQLQKIPNGEDLDSEHHSSGVVNTTAKTTVSDEKNKSDDEEVESSEEAETTLGTSKMEKAGMSKLSKSQKRRLRRKLQKRGKEPQVSGVDKPKKEAEGEQHQDFGDGPAAKPGKNVMKEKKAKADSDDSEVKDEAQLQKIPNGEDLDSEHHSSGVVNTTAKTTVSDEKNKSDDEEVESSEEAETTLGTSKMEKAGMSKLSKSQKRRLRRKLQKRGKEPQVSGVDKPKKEAEGEQHQDFGDGPAAKPGKNVMASFQ